MPRRASRQELPNISNEMGCVRCDGKAVLRKEDFMDKKAGLDGILAGGKERGDLMEHGGGLLRFLKPTRSALSVLVVESPAYLPKLREMMPAAALFAVTAETDDTDASELQGLDVSWFFLDYRDTPLPFKRESFDYILADRCLETAGNPQDIAAGFGLFLRPTGCLLTSFLNVRHWSVIEDLRDGHFYAIVRRLFALPEMETLLAASFYKEVSFLPVWREAPQGLIERLEAAGFENPGRDLEAKFWLCRARRTSDEVAPLKECFTPAVRRTLVTLLRRLEYGIEVEENAAALWQLYLEEGIFPEYLLDFAAQTIVHQRDLLRVLLQTAGPQLAGEIAEAAQRRLPRGEVRDILQGFAAKSVKGAAKDEG